MFNVYIYSWACLRFFFSPFLFPKFFRHIGIARMHWEQHFASQFIVKSFYIAFFFLLRSYLCFFFPIIFRRWLIGYIRECITFNAHQLAFYLLGFAEICWWSCIWEKRGSVTHIETLSKWTFFFSKGYILINISPLNSYIILVLCLWESDWIVCMCVSVCVCSFVAINCLLANHLNE